MGYVQSKPVVSASGDALSILYTGGDKCHIGTEMESFRSTRVTFICAGVEVRMREQEWREGGRDRGRKSKKEVK